MIGTYNKIHGKGAAWSEITNGIREVGIIDTEIYISGTRLFMIMDTIPEFDHENAMTDLVKKPSQKECEAYVSKFQQSNVRQKLLKNGN